MSRLPTMREVVVGAILIAVVCRFPGLFSGFFHLIFNSLQDQVHNAFGGPATHVGHGEHLTRTVTTPSGNALEHARHVHHHRSH